MNAIMSNKDILKQNNLVSLKEIKTEPERMQLAKMYGEYLEQLSHYSVMLQNKLFSGNKALMVYEESVQHNHRKDYFIVCGSMVCGFIFIGTYPNSFSAADIYIQEFYVQEAYRRTGVGSQAVRLLQKKYNKDISLFILKRNIPADTFWKKIMRETGYYDRASLGGINTINKELDWYYFKKEKHQIT